MRSIPQTTRQMESISKQTSLFFRRYHNRQNLTVGQCLQAQGIFFRLCFLRTRQHHFRESLPLHATQASFGISAVRQGYGLPLLELLPHELAPVHVVPRSPHHQRYHPTVDRGYSALLHHCGRFAFHPLAFQTRGALSQGLRPCELPLYERLPSARRRMDRWKYVSAADILPPFDGEREEPHPWSLLVRRCKEQWRKAAQARANASPLCRPPAARRGQGRRHPRAARSL